MPVCIHEVTSKTFPLPLFFRKKHTHVHFRCGDNPILTLTICTLIRLLPLPMRVGQMLWVWCVSLPVTLLNSTEVNPGVTARDVAGLIMFIVGFFFEFVGDIQKDIFKVGFRAKSLRSISIEGEQ